MDENRIKFLTSMEYYDLITELTDKVKKAQALCDEVLTQYCDRNALDPFSDNEDLRTHSKIVCALYPTWSELLHCVSDYLLSADEIIDRL